VAATGCQMAGIYGLQPHPAICDELATRDVHFGAHTAADLRGHGVAAQVPEASAESADLGPHSEQYPLMHDERADRHAVQRTRVTPEGGTRSLLAAGFHPP
jgi:hypothetical protein